MKSKFLNNSSLGKAGYKPASLQTIGDMIGEPTAHWSDGEFQSPSEEAAAKIAAAGRRLGLVK